MLLKNHESEMNHLKQQKIKLQKDIDDINEEVNKKSKIHFI